MIYREYDPSSLLSEYIDKYWIVKDISQQAGKFKILPDGYSDFIFCLAGTSASDGNRKIVQPHRGFYVGAMTTFSELVKVPAKIDMLGVRFKPGGLYPFSDIPLHEFKNQRISISDSGFLFSPGFADRLCELRSTQERIAAIETFLYARLSQRFITDPQVAFAIKQMTDSCGQISIGKLMNEICLCQRHFERRFRERTGYSPKELARIVRFRHATAMLQQAVPENFQHFALDCGYYDHSHMVKEFRLLSGSSPAEFSSFPGKGPIQT